MRRQVHEVAEAKVIEQWREAVRAVHGVESKYKRLVKAIAGDIETCKP
jgi:hypothetical protein